MYGLIDSVTSFMNKQYRSQSPNMCLLRNHDLAFPASQDATCDSARKAQQNGYDVSPPETACFRSLTLLVEETFSSQCLLHLS
jgi:hypothetical protein